MGAVTRLTRIRTFSELIQLPTLEDRFRYLALRAEVGDTTFGSERWMNQGFYTSREWRQVRQYVIARDHACDLAMPGQEIFGRGQLEVHHMNPMTPDDLIHGNEAVLDPEFLVSTRSQTHKGIHYGDERQLPRPLVVRTPGDTKLW